MLDLYRTRPDQAPRFKADIQPIDEIARFVRIGDIRPRILLRQTMNGHFGEAAPQRRPALDRPLRAIAISLKR
jgi:hypothetical protein